MDFPSALLSFLAGATVRSLVLAVLPLALLAAFRVKSAATRHAVLLLVTAGMMALAALNPLLPAIPLPVLRAGAPALASVPALPAPAIAVGDAVAPPVPTPGRPLGPVAPLFPSLLAAVYFAGVVFCLMRLLFGALFTRRLLRGARHIESGLGSSFGSHVYESSWISVPLTLGWRRPRILLPPGWQQWDRLKLDAVLVHERNHIRRRDWAIALLAAVNRSLYWFNPLAWWLERRLAALAEQACDDAALLALGQRESYAQALLDMATAVKTGQGRLVWDAMAMAKGTEVRMRIERILDDNRPIPRGLTRSRWLVLVACSLPLIYLTAALRPVPAEAQDQGQTPPAIAELLHARRPLTAGDAAQMEQYLAANPGDLQVREQLILYYFSAGVSEPRLTHIYWLIANHPESSEAALTSRGITPRATSFNTTADYERAAGLWRQQAGSHPSDDKVLTNTAMFFAQPGGDPNEAERLLLQVRALHPNTADGADRLANLYATAILGTSGDPKFPNDNPDFGNRVRAQIENGTDGPVTAMTGSQLAGAARRPQPGGSLAPGTLNLDEHPLLIPIVELGHRLMERAPQLPGPRLFVFGNGALFDPRGAGAAGTRLQADRAAAVDAIRTQPGITSAQQANPGLPVLSPKPAAVSVVQPAYPPLARQARIQGVVSLAVAISPDGHVTNLTVLRGHPLLVQTAIEAVRQWVYSPVPQAGMFEEDVNFTLSQNEIEQTPPLPADTPRKQANLQLPALSPRPATVSVVDPTYPPLARQARIQGVVGLAVTISPEGRPTNLSVLRGHPLLVQAALDAVKQWVYSPVPQAVTFEEDVNFVLPPNSIAQGQSAADAASALPPQAGPLRVKVGPLVQAAQLLNKVDPVYPEQAKAAGIQGPVTLQIVIANDGTVETVTPVEGHPLLVAAAQDAVKQWVYKPTLLNGHPVEVATTVTVPFELNQ
jgi:TonB family protein